MTDYTTQYTVLKAEKVDGLLRNGLLPIADVDFLITVTDGKNNYKRYYNAIKSSITINKKTVFISYYAVKKAYSENEKTF